MSGMSTMRITVGITGASGGVLAVRFISRVIALGIRVDLVVTGWGWKVMDTELELTGRYPGNTISSALTSMLGITEENDGYLTIHDNENLFSKLASGSSANDRMIVVPCSAGSMARIAQGQSRCLLERAADVVIKEGNILVLAVRESPLSKIHLRNLLELAQIGVVICPPLLTFYHKPQNVIDLIDINVDKMIKVMGIDAAPRFQWMEPTPGA